MTLNLPSKSHIRNELLMSQDDFKEHQLDITEYLDTDTIVPVAVYDRHGVPKYVGCNTYPHGVNRTYERQARPEKYLWIEHAERNAIYAMAKDGKPTIGCIMCILWYPCADCARAIVQSGISILLCSKPDMANEQWGQHFRVAAKVLEEGGVRVYYYEDKEDGWN